MCLDEGVGALSLLFSILSPYLVRFYDFRGDGVPHAGAKVVVHDGQRRLGLIYDLEGGGQGLGRLLWMRRGVRRG